MENCQLLKKDSDAWRLFNFTHTHTHTQYTHIHIHTHTYTHTHTHTYSHTHSHTHSRARARAHAHTHTHTLTHTTLFLRKAPRHQKQHFFLFHSSQASPACPYDSSTEMKMSVQQWCKNTNRENQSSGRKICPSATSSATNLTRAGLGSTWASAMKDWRLEA